MKRLLGLFSTKGKNTNEAVEEVVKVVESSEMDEEVSDDIHMIMFRKRPISPSKDKK